MAEFPRHRVAAFPNDAAEMFRVGVAFGVDQQNLRGGIQLHLFPEAGKAGMFCDEHQRARHAEGAEA